VARGDPVFTKFDNAVRHSKKLHKLKPDERHVYWMLNIICTEERRDVLLGGSYGPSYVAREADVDRRIALRALRHMAQVRLIELTDKWSIFVYDVRDRHRKLPFHERPIWPPNGETLLPYSIPRSAPYPVDIRDQRSEEDISTDPDTEIVTQRHDQAPPPDGAREDGQTARPGESVDVKKLLEEQEKKREAERSRMEPITQIIHAAGNPDREMELEREVHLWFLELWPHGEYDWDAEKDSLLSQVRKYGRGAYNVARGILLEQRRANRQFTYGELAYLNGTARNQADKLKV
jgi:hypothetical protein